MTTPVVRRRWAGVVVAVLLPIAVLGLVLGRQAGEAQRTRAAVDGVVAGGCLFWGDLAALAASQKTAPTVSQLGLRIFADSWPAYDTHRCPARYGPLPEPPPWLRAAVADAYRRAAAKTGQAGGTR